MKLCRAGHHLGGEAISSLTWEPVLHAAVSERLKEHGGESRAAAGKRARDGEQMPGKHLDKRDGGEEPDEGFPFINVECMPFFAGDDSLADGDRCVGNQMCIRDSAHAAALEDKRDVVYVGFVLRHGRDYTPTKP